MFLKSKKKADRFEIEFFENDILSNPECEMDDTVTRCPNKNAYLTNLYVSSPEVALLVIKILNKIIENYWIQSDEEDNWFGTNIEFLNR